MRTLQAALVVAFLLAGACSDADRSSSMLLDAASLDGGDGAMRTGTDAEAGSCRERTECIGLDAASTLRDAATSNRDAATSNQDASTISQEASLLCGANGFPSFSRACQTQSDCVVVEHQINCCGTRVATGVRSESRAAFEAAEMSCRTSYPACGCAELATRADDGTVASGSAGAHVECLAGGCSTTFLPAIGGSCATGEASCGLGYSCCYPCGIPGCSSVCTPSCAAGSAACSAGCRQVP